MNFPAWHDAAGWMALVKELKAATGAEGVSVEFNMPHGIHTYLATDEDSE